MLVITDKSVTLRDEDCFRDQFPHSNRVEANAALAVSGFGFMAQILCSDAPSVLNVVLALQMAGFGGLRQGNLTTSAAQRIPWRSLCSLSPRVQVPKN